MRFYFVILCAVVLSACATTPDATGSAKITETTLKPGECGLYGWSVDAKRDFIFFADENSARYNSVTGPADLNAQSAFPSLDYLDEAGRSVTLRLGSGEVMDGGMRYPSARIVTMTDEGWERLQPVAMVRSCQPI